MKSDLQKECFVEFRNKLEQEFIDNLPDDNPEMFKDYGKLSSDDFMYVYRRSVKPELRDHLRIIDAINEAIINETYQIDMSNLIISGEDSEKHLSVLLDTVAMIQNMSLSKLIDQLYNLDLDNFDHNLGTAQKIHHYAECSKDYMRNPKGSGYQSFHLIVRTPFGRYEKQFRTEAQHQFAEYGEASHSKFYKPYEKSDFHRLKVPTPFMPARDDEGEIILPIRLQPLEFDEAIKAYYHKDFRFFSGGLSMETFKQIHEDDFDEAILDLSQPSEKMLERLALKFGFLKGFDKKKVTQPQSNVNARKKPKSTIDLRKNPKTLDFNPYDNR